MGWALRMHKRSVDRPGSLLLGWSHCGHKTSGEILSDDWAAVTCRNCQDCPEYRTWLERRGIRKGLVMAREAACLCCREGHVADCCGGVWVHTFPNDPERCYEEEPCESPELCRLIDAHSAEDAG